MMPGVIQRTGLAQKLANKRYRELGDILRRDDISNGVGGKTPRDPLNPWPVVATEVRCRVDATGRMPSEGQVDNRVTSEGPYDVAFPKGTDIRNADRVRMTTMAGRVFVMIAPRFATDEISRIMAAKEVV